MHVLNNLHMSNLRIRLRRQANGKAGCHHRHLMKVCIVAPFARFTREGIVELRVAHTMYLDHDCYNNGLHHR